MSTNGVVRMVIRQRLWPGLDNYEPPRRPRMPDRLADRIGLVFVALPELGVVPKRLGLGGWLVVCGDVVLGGGFVHADGFSERDPEGYEALREWCSGHVLLTARRCEEVASAAAGCRQAWPLVDATTFSRDVLRPNAYRGRGVVFGADLGRSFGLLAAWYRPSPQTQGFRDGWRLGVPGWGVVSEQTGKWDRDTGLPELLLGQLGVRGTRLAFGPPRPSFEGERRGEWEPIGSRRRRAYPGRFVDLIAAAFALDGVDSDDFGDHLDAWGLPRLDPRAVRPDIDGAQDVAALLDAQHRLAVRLDAEAAGWGVGLDELASPPSVAAKVLGRMGVKAPLDQVKLPRREPEAWTRTLHGGWVSSDLLRRILPAADVDIRSAYPVLAHHLGWWELLIAERVRTKRVTKALRRFLARAPAELAAAMHDPATWRRWGFTRAVVRARGATLPVSVVDDTDGRDRLVVHPVEAERLDVTVWDLVAAADLDGECRFEVLEAVMLVPEGRQRSLSAVDVPDGRLDPRRDPAVDLVRLRAEAKAAGGPDNLRRAAMLRVLTNGLTYGNLARFDDRPGVGEKPGPWCWPPLASTVTAACRCALAVLEAEVRDRGGAVVARDTDGAIVAASPNGGDVDLGDGRSARALSWAELDEMLAAWDGLALDGGPIWKVERGEPDAPLWAGTFGPKKYSLVQRDDDGRLSVVDATEIALGGYVAPPTMPERDADGAHVWCREVARAHAQRADDGRPVGRFSWEHEAGAGFPVLERWQPSTPEALAELGKALGARPFARILTARAKSFSPGIDDTADQDDGKALLPRPVTLDPGGNLADWRDLDWRDAHTGRPIRVTTDPDDALGANVVGLVMLGDVARSWARARDPSLPECIRIDRLLVRGVGRPTGRFHGGRRQATLTEANDAGALCELARLIGSARFAEVTDLPRRTADRIRAGTRPRRDTVQRALEALRRRGLTIASALDLAHRDRNVCAHPGCSEPVRQFGARCAAHQREYDGLRKRRQRAELTRGVPCQCGTIVGFGGVQPGWRAECCPNPGRKRSPIRECPWCGALLLGTARHEPVCFACGEPLPEGLDTT